MRAKHHRRNAAKAAAYAALEEQLRAALNGEVAVEEPPQLVEPAPPHRSHQHKVTALHTHKTTVRYSVRHSWGGHRFNVSYTKDTISELEAKLMAEADITKNRYIDVVHLETIHL